MPIGPEATGASPNGAPSIVANGRPADEFSFENRGRTRKPPKDGAPFGRGRDGTLEASTKEAQRRFHALLAVAAENPVYITRRGRRRAVVMSARMFVAYQEAFHACAETTTLATLLGALTLAEGATDDASLGAAEEALAAAKKLNALVGATLVRPRPRP